MSAMSLFVRQGGEETVIEREVQCSEIIKRGMAQAAKAYAYWRENCRIIVEEFWGVQPREFRGRTPSEIVRLLREAGGEPATPWALLYASLVQLSPSWDKYLMAAAKVSAADPGTAAHDDAKVLARGHLADARALASAQARIILRHFAQKAADAKAASDSQRETVGAVDLIRETIREWSARIETRKGAFKDAGERALLGDACDALKAVLAKHQRDKNPQSVIVPPKGVEEEAVL